MAEIRRGPKRKKIRSAQTIANKERRAQTRANKLTRARERRASMDYVMPMNALIPANELPKKVQAKIEIYDANGNMLMYPHPMRGMLARGQRLHRALTSRVFQAERVTRKRQARQEFQKLSLVEKRNRRELGARQFGTVAS